MGLRVQVDFLRLDFSCIFIVGVELDPLLVGKGSSGGVRWFLRACGKGVE